MKEYICVYFINLFGGLKNNIEYIIKICERK